MFHSANVLPEKWSHKGRRKNYSKAAKLRKHKRPLTESASSKTKRKPLPYPTNKKALKLKINGNIGIDEVKGFFGTDELSS